MVGYSVKIVRTLKQDKQTLGIMYVFFDGKIVYQCNTLELGWHKNKNKSSCIPIGSYKVEKRKSPKYGSHFWIKDVPNRDLILIHNGNYYTQTLGCILVGNSLMDINKDGLLDVVSSKPTMTKLNTLLPENFNIEIICAV